MRNIVAQSKAGAPNTIVDLRAVRGRITHLDYALRAELRKLLPGQALSAAFVGQLAEYCAGAAYLEVHDPESRFARRRNVASLNAAVLAAIVADGTAKQAA